MKATSEIKVGILVELTRAFGRDLCAGITAFAQEHEHERLAPFFVDLKSLKEPSTLAKFDGFIARVMNDEMARRLSASRKPVIDVYYEKPRKGFAVVKTNHARLGRLAAEHFIERKFSTFGYCGFSGGRFSDYCRQAFCRALSSKGHACNCYEPAPTARYEFDPSVLINERLDRAPDAKDLSRWVERLQKPIAVFCPNDLRAWQLLQVCKSRGIDVPHEVAILGLDNDVLVCGFSKPMISSIDPNTAEIGREAMRTLMELIDSPRLARKPIVRQVNPAGVVERTSTEVYPIDPRWLSDALIFIRKHVQSHLTASDVYAYLNRSHTTVDAVFRRVLDKTVQQTIATARTEKARHLLLTSDLPIVRIAGECGFSSQEYFSRSFSEENGIPPEAWRTKHRKDTSRGV